MNYSLESRIDEVGEFDFLNKFLLPVFNDHGIGDDVAYINSPGSKIIVTSDAGPSNVEVIPKEFKFRNQGWLLAVANISDLASAGAHPLGISNSIDIPGDMLVRDCIEFFEEFKRACDQYGVRVTGGNIRQRKIFSSHATVLGFLDKDDYEIRRTGIASGDLVYIVGIPGAFAIAYLEARKHGFDKITELQRKTLLQPTAKLSEMLALRKHFRIVASSDVSDGVIGSLKNLQDASNVGFEIDENTIYHRELIEAAKNHNINPLNIFNFWGDWNMVIIVNPKDKIDLEAFCASNQFALTNVGTAIKENGIVFKSAKGEKHLMEIVRNENFRSYSFNSHVVNSIDYMLSTPLLRDPC